MDYEEFEKDLDYNDYYIHDNINLYGSNERT